MSEHLRVKNGEQTNSTDIETLEISVRFWSFNLKVSNKYLPKVTWTEKFSLI